MEPVNQLEKCQREQTEGSEISQEMSSNLTEEDGPSHEMKKKIVELHVPVVVNGKHDCTSLQDSSPPRTGPVYRHTDCLGWEEYPGKGHCVPVFF